MHNRSGGIHLKKILIPYKCNEKAVAYLRQYAEVDCFNDAIDQEKAMAIVDQYDAIINRGFAVKINETLIAQGSKLKVLGLCKVGLDDVAVDFAKTRGIAVYNAVGVSTNAVAEVGMWHMLNLHRKVSKSLALASEGLWHQKATLGAYELADKTLGIIALGRVGKRMADFGKFMHMHVIAFDPYLGEPGTVVEGVELVSFETLLARADTISVHCPLTPDTMGLFNAAVFAKMKRGAYIINGARGKIIDEDDLYDAVVSGQIGGAGLDVLASEPMAKGYKLSQLENVFITPHLGDIAIDTQEKIAMFVAEKVLRELGCIS
jgi:D-3-phosphoglycerate dehydrogenase